MRATSLIASVVFSLSVLGGASCGQATGPSPVSGAVPSASGYELETLVKGLAHPWSMAWLPNGDMLVTERPGRLRVVRDGQLLSEPVAGVPEVLAFGQGGLMEVSLHPRFEQTKWVYLTYSAGTRNENRTVIARVTLDGNTLRDVKVIFEVNRLKSGGQHFGSRIAWMKDGTMLVAIGDGGNPPVRYQGELIRNLAQDRTSHTGKVLRLNEDGTPARDNPFADGEDGAPAVWSYGHRNIQGLAIDPETGKVWANEHGPRGGDELNLIEPGKNYGWPVVTYGREYFGPAISDQTSKPGMVDPTLVWTPSKAASGLVVYRGDAFPEWRGDLFSGALMFQEVRRVTIKDDKVVHEDAIKIGSRVRDVREGPDGLLYVLTDEPNGELIRIKPKRTR